LEKGQIINDAIIAAGGFTQDANKNINLVYTLNENVTLRIKSVLEENVNANTAGLEIIKTDTANSTSIVSIRNKLTMFDIKK